MEAEQNMKRAKRPQIAPPRLPLVGQIYLWGLIVLGFVLLVSSASAWFLVNRQAYEQIDNDTQNLLDSFEYKLNQDTDALVLFGQWLANQGNTSVFEQSRDAAAAARSMKMLLQIGGLDFILITDGRGRVLAQTGALGVSGPSDDFSTSPDIAEAIAGQMSTRTEVDASRNLAVTLVIPMRGQKENLSPVSAPDTPTGAIRLGFYIDNAYLEDFQEKSGLDVDLVVISTDPLGGRMLAGRGANPQMDQFGTENGNLDDRALHAGQLVTLMTNRGPYLYKFRPLETPSRSGSLLIGSGVRTVILEREREKWFETFGLWLLVGLVCLGGVGFLMAGSFTQSLNEISGAVQQIRDGNLSSRLVLRRRDEFGDLALHLESMRKELGQKLKATSLERDGAAAAIRAMTVPVVITDSQNRIAAANCAAEALIGFGSGFLVGRPWHTIFALPEASDSGDLPVWHAASQAADEHHPSIAHGRLALNTGCQPIVYVNSVPFDVEGELAGYVHTLQDVSEIDRFAKAKDDFLLSVAHELKGPLASWRLSVELLLEDYGEMTRHELGLMLRTLQKTVVRFQGLVEALVDMGKLEAGKFRVQPTPMLYEKLIEDSLSQIGPALQIKGQDLQVRIGTKPSCRVMADRTRISQVIINLLRNASKYSPEGEPIIVETHETAGRVFFQVTDRGNGIEPEEQEHIFARYYRSKRVEDDGAGIGLGLALAKAIMEAHGGQIGVSSEVGKGSTFWFSLSEIAAVDNKSELEGTSESPSSRR